jgi:hypothetical protein
MFFTHPEDVLIGMYHGVNDGTTNTFNANSSISFGNTVPEKK